MTPALFICLLFSAGAFAQSQIATNFPMSKLLMAFSMRFCKEFETKTVRSETGLLFARYS
jgi:hypothetical protein